MYIESEIPPARARKGYKEILDYWNCWNVGDGMLEKIIEQKLVKAVKAMGGIAPKFVSPGYDGMPDRLILLPDGKIAFVEVKATGRKPRPIQLQRHETLRRLGFMVFVLDDVQQIAPLLSAIGGDA